MEEKDVKKKTTNSTKKSRDKVVGDSKASESKSSVKRRTNKKPEKPAEEVVTEEKKEEVKEIIVEKQSGFNILEVIIIMFITLCFGGLLGSALTYAVGNNGQIITSIPEELQEFVKTYEDITDNYYEEIDRDKLLNAGIEGMLSFLEDKYSVYMSEEESETFNEQVEGKYVGIGSEIQRLENGDTIISDPFKGGPAYKAGLQVGDIILKVEGEDVTGFTLSEIAKRVKGEQGTTVFITIQRGEEIIEVPVIRNEVELTSVTSKILETGGHKVGYLEIDIFAANTAQQFEKQLLQLESEKIDSLIIDVRNNSGGYLSTVQEIASLFLEKGKNIYQLDTKGLIEEVRDTTKASRNYPVAVLINRASASASEILAAAIKESYVDGEVVGVNSYGKGTVQKAYQLESGATVKYTIQKWLTPNGSWIDGVGIEPTKVVELASEYYENPSEENDNQLQETLKLLIEKE